MKVHWFEQSLADVRTEDDWFDAWERSHLNTLRFSKRRADWRLGRWTAKHAVAEYLHLPRHPGTLATIRIQPATSGAPEVFIDEVPAAVSISLSHRGGIAACLVGPPEAMFGCDLEVIEPRTDVFVADYFTAEEQAMIWQAPVATRFALIALIWSAKESALKALRTGLRISTQHVGVRLDDPCWTALNPQLPTDGNLAAVSCARPIWQPLRVNHNDSQVFHGWWFRRADLIRTLVSMPPTEELMISVLPAKALPHPEPNPRTANRF